VVGAWGNFQGRVCCLPSIGLLDVHQPGYFEHVEIGGGIMSHLEIMAPKAMITD
jgi:hypothetical protein